MAMLAVPRTPETPHPTPPHRVVPVARLLSGEALFDVDLSGAADVAEARILIAASLGAHPSIIQLIDMASHTVLNDKMPLTGDVQVVRLATNPVAEVAEHDAELAFVTAAQVGSMNDLSDRESLIRVRQSQLLVLPESLQHLTTLQCLDLRGNELTHLPESIGRLTALRILDLTKNQLRALPKSFGQLEALSSLHLHANQLFALPESFGELGALRNLHLSRNQLTKLPESFGQLSALRKLYLKGNKLKRFPEALRQLLMLQVLDL